MSWARGNHSLAFSTASIHIYVQVVQVRLSVCVGGGGVACAWTAVS